MPEAYSHEIVHQIWNDKTGDRIEVGEDRDGLELVEIRYIDGYNKIVESVSMTMEQAVLVHAALTSHLGLDAFDNTKIGGTD